MATGHYFRSPENWTLDRDDAFDFGLVSKAMKTAHELRIPGLELELTLDEPARDTAVSFGQFLLGLSHPGKPRAGRRATSHRAVVA